MLTSEQFINTRAVEVVLLTSCQNVGCLLTPCYHKGMKIKWNLVFSEYPYTFGLLVLQYLYTLKLKHWITNITDCDEVLSSIPNPTPSVFIQHSAPVL